MTMSLSHNTPMTVRLGVGHSIARPLTLMRDPTPAPHTSSYHQSKRKRTSEDATMRYSLALRGAVSRIVHRT